MEMEYDIFISMKQSTHIKNNNNTLKKIIKSNNISHSYLNIEKEKIYCTLIMSVAVLPLGEIIKTIKLWLFLRCEITKFVLFQQERYLKSNPYQSFIKILLQDGLNNRGFRLCKKSII